MAFSEERKMILLGLFYQALEDHDLDHLVFALEEEYDESWEEMSPDEIWKAQAQFIQNDHQLPEDLLVFADPEPDWKFAEANLSQYGQTF